MTRKVSASSFACHSKDCPSNNFLLPPSPRVRSLSTNDNSWPLAWAGGPVVGATNMEEAHCRELAERIARRARRAGVKLDVVSPTRVRVGELLGEGGNARTYAGSLLDPPSSTEKDEGCAADGVGDDSVGSDPAIAVRVIESIKDKEVIAECAHVDVPISTQVHGVSWVPSRGGDAGDANASFRVCMLLERCETDLDDFLQTYDDEIGLGERVGLLRQALVGLTQLKAKGIVWRDLKGQNMLVRSFVRRPSSAQTSVEGARTHAISAIALRFADWGTCADLSLERDRRMTIGGGGGTYGFIAPETKWSTYSYSADMFAFLVWAAMVCLTKSPKEGAAKAPPPRQEGAREEPAGAEEAVAGSEEEETLDEAIGDLRLETNMAAPRRQQSRVVRVLEGFAARGRVRPDCAALYAFISQQNWTDPEARWTCEAAIEALDAFARLHGLAGREAPSEPVASAVASATDDAKQPTRCGGSKENAAPARKTAEGKGQTKRSARANPRRKRAPLGMRSVNVVA